MFDTNGKGFRTALAGSSRQTALMAWLAAIVFLSAAGVRSIMGTPADVPSVNAQMGSCTADFRVVDPSNKPIYDAQVHVKIKYGFMSKRDTDLQVATNSDGKARVEGLPDRLKKPPMDFSVTKEDKIKIVSNDPATNCHATFSITLGN